MMNLDVRVARTYKQLFDGLLELLAETDFDNLSVSKICEHSGVHRATFYKHFEDKNEFLDYCIISKLLEIPFSQMENDPTPENIKNDVMNCISEVLKFINKNKPIIEASFSECHSSSFKNAFYEAVVQFCVDKFTPILKQDDYKMKLFANFYAGAFVGIIKWYLFNKTPVEDPEKVIYLFCERRIDEIVGYYATNLFEVL